MNQIKSISARYNNITCASVKSISNPTECKAEPRRTTLQNTLRLKSASVSAGTGTCVGVGVGTDVEDRNRIAELAATVKGRSNVDECRVARNRCIIIVVVGCWFVDNILKYLGTKSD